MVWWYLLYDRFGEEYLEYFNFPLESKRQATKLLQEQQKIKIGNEIVKIVPLNFWRWFIFFLGKKFEDYSFMG